MIETCPPSLVRDFLAYISDGILSDSCNIIVGVYSLTEAAINKYTNMVAIVHKMLHSQNDDISY